MTRPGFDSGSAPCRPRTGPWVRAVKPHVTGGDSSEPGKERAGSRRGATRENWRAFKDVVPVPLAAPPLVALLSSSALGQRQTEEQTLPSGLAWVSPAHVQRGQWRHKA